MDNRYSLSQLRASFLEHFAVLGYKKHPASSLIPKNDPSVLLTTAGMQQFKDFYTMPKQAPSKDLTTTQPVIRTTDIAEVGDNTHLTLFEMLGIFSFGHDDLYALKKQSIAATWQFISQTLGVEKSRVFATVFAGDELAPEDTDSREIWEELGVSVQALSREDNFWGPTGDEGPCGPTSEIFIDDIEVGNLVFNQYYQDREKNFKLLEHFGLDYGGGLERLATTLQGKQSVWEIEPFVSWLGEDSKNNRIILDHLRATVFLVSAGIAPSNKGREYVLRRLIRKMVFLSQDKDWAVLTAQISSIVSFYKNDYSLMTAQEIEAVVEQEKNQFERNIARAKSYLGHWLETNQQADEHPITQLAFYMYESFGFPRELVIEYLNDLGYQVDTKQFEKLFEQHQQVSRAGVEGQFKGGLADHQTETVKHHTAHHLLLAALQEVLGKQVVQRGSNITNERLRLDFNFDRKLTNEELEKVALIVNEKIADQLPVECLTMAREEALQSGAQAEFGQKYGEIVTVYTIKNKDGSVFSKELCGGPHVANTSELGHFEILKEEASSQGVRRIKARLV